MRSLLALLTLLAPPATAVMIQTPIGAVQVDPGLFMRPVGLDDTACLAYQPWSPADAVAQAVHYQRGDGSFTRERAEAACGTIARAGAG